MKKFFGTIISVCLLSSSINLSSAGNLDMTDEQNVKLARNKAMLRSLKHKDSSDYIGASIEERIRRGFDKMGCGSVDIGNVLDHGIGGPREIDIIITGDIINANNRCK